VLNNQTTKHHNVKQLNLNVKLTKYQYMRRTINTILYTVHLLLAHLVRTNARRTHQILHECERGQAFLMNASTNEDDRAGSSSYPIQGTRELRYRAPLSYMQFFSVAQQPKAGLAACFDRSRSHTIGHTPGSTPLIE